MQFGAQNSANLSKINKIIVDTEQQSKELAKEIAVGINAGSVIVFEGDLG